MDKLQCEKCGEEFEFLSQRRRHVSRKTPCTMKLATHECRHCGKAFAHLSGLSRHSRKCAPRRSAKIKPALEADEDLRAKIVNLEHKLEALKIFACEQSGGGTTLINSNNTYNIQNALALNMYGREDMSRAATEDLRGLLALHNPGPNPSQEDLYAAGEQAYVTLFQHLYANINHPENLTCYLATQTSSLAHVHVSPGRWDQIPLSRATQELSTRAYNQLESHQPVDDNARRLAPLLRTMFDNESKYRKSPILPPLLHTNKDRLVAAGVALAES